MTCASAAGNKVGKEILFKGFSLRQGVGRKYEGPSCCLIVTAHAIALKKKREVRHQRPRPHLLNLCPSVNWQLSLGSF